MNFIINTATTEGDRDEDGDGDGDDGAPPGIPFVNYYLLYFTLALTIGVIYITRKKLISNTLFFLIL